MTEPGTPSPWPRTTLEPGSGFQAAFEGPTCNEASGCWCCPLGLLDTVLFRPLSDPQATAKALAPVAPVNPDVG